MKALFPYVITWLMLVLAITPVVGPAVDTDFTDLTVWHSHVFTAQSDLSASHHPCNTESASAKCSTANDAGLGLTTTVTTPDTYPAVTPRTLDINWLSRGPWQQSRPDEWTGTSLTPPRQTVA